MIVRPSGIRGVGATSQNTNADFENGAAGFNLVGAYIMDKFAKTGSKRVEINPGGQVSTLPIACDPTDVVNVAVWVTSAVKSSGQAALYLDFLNGATVVQRVPVSAAGNTNTAWQYLSGTVTAPTGVTQVRATVDFSSEKTDDWAIDGFSLTVAPVVTPADTSVATSGSSMLDPTSITDQISVAATGWFSNTTFGIPNPLLLVVAIGAVYFLKKNG